MPNWYTTIARPKSMKDFGDAVKMTSDNGCYHRFELNNIIPMPEELNETHSPSLFDANPFSSERPVETALKMKFDAIYMRDDFHEKAMEILNEEEFASALPCYITKEEVIKAYVCKQKYGYSNWYDWRVENWGTKWDIDANSIYCDNLSVEFQTAWAPPIPVLQKISRSVPLLVLGADEGDTRVFAAFFISGTQHNFNPFDSYPRERQRALERALSYRIKDGEDIEIEEVNEQYEGGIGFTQEDFDEARKIFDDLVNKCF